MNEADKCSHCGAVLTFDHKGPCPNCRKSGKIINLKANSVGVSITGTRTRLTTVKEYYEKHPTIMALGIFITLGISLVGFFLQGYLGLLVGFTLSMVLYFLGGRPLRTHHKEIDRG
jgi:hypothetical protein